MKRIYIILVTIALSLGLTETSLAQSYWTDEAHPPIENQLIRPAKYRSMHLDETGLRKVLDIAPMEAETPVAASTVILYLPMPDGSTEAFRIAQSPVMAKELQQRFPDIRSFIGQGISNSRNSVRFDLSHKGFHAMIFHDGSTVYIDPIDHMGSAYYMSYTREAFYQSTNKVWEETPPLLPDDFDLHGFDEAIEKPSGKDKPLKNDKEVLTMGMANKSATPFGTQLREYRTAVACTGEYGQFHGGTVADALAAINTTMTRVNSVYERDIAVRMTLVANNDQVIFLNGATDPFTNSSAGALINENQGVCDANIGAANYDVGHVFSTGGGGVAQLFSPCTGNKARGVSGLGSPVGDPFDIDYVCHEFGHQYGANHTQNNNCNRAGSAAFEPGSASTIMGYAGICPPNIQNNSDDHFHNHSINEMHNFVVNGTGNTCPTITNTGNNVPTVDAGTGGWVIPLSTPFELTATASDPDPDVLTYNWEQYDLGPSTAAGDNNLTNPSGTQPIFRSFSSTENPTRVFPRITDLVNNTTVIGEFLPDYARSMTFRCTVRDNSAGGGGVQDDQVSFDVTDLAGPFVVTAPNTAVVFPGNSFQTITWDVANTDAAPVNCAAVDIYLSTDGGLTYPTLLLANTPNDGSEVVLIPAGETTTARIKVKGDGNIFFDISNQNFTIGPAVGVNNLDAGILNIEAPGGDICADAVTPEVTIANFGNNTLTSFDIVYDIDGGSPQTFNWTGSLLTGESESVALPDIALASGSYTFNVELQNPNGSADENPTNNSGSSGFSLTSGGSQVTFTFVTDCWGEEVSWTLADDLGNVIDNVGVNTYADQSTNVNTYCLSAGCYTLTINDSFGDGVFGSQYGSCGVDGDYSVVDPFGNVLVQMANPDYGNQIIESFCVGDGTPGCTDPAACNFDPDATINDGTCTFPGCTNPAACNFDAAAGCDNGSCILPDGCTDPEACNFDPAATCDDGSCVVPDGCTDPAACNFDPDATCNDGSCTFPPAGFDCDCNAVTNITATLNSSASANSIVSGGGTPTSVDLELNWTNVAGDGSWAGDLVVAITDPNGVCFEFGGFNVTAGCTQLGDVNIYPAGWQQSTSGLYNATIDLSGTGLTGTGDWDITILNGWASSGGAGYDLTLTFTGLCIEDLIPGCTDPTACNFDPAATQDNGSCILPDGCTDPAACNFDPAAQCDNGSCILPDGCTDPAACNFDPAAQCDNGSCILPDGCTDPAACNFDPAAQCDNGSCILPDGCTDPAACNFDPAAQCDNGSCILPDGCTDPAACNFDPAAQCDDASCAFAQTYYADNDGDGFGAGAPVNLCAPQAGFVQDNTDCDDANNEVYPGAPGTAEGLDNDCNGVVDPDEEALCAGDFNSDGQINVGDLLILLGEVGCSNACTVDLNGDGVTNSADALVFFGLFGTSCN